MENLLRLANQFFEQLPDKARQHRLKIWLLFIVVCIGVIAGAARFKVDMTMEAYFRANDPIKHAYDRFRAQFGSDEVLFLIYRAKDGDIFSPASLTAVKGLQQDLLNYRLNRRSSSDGEEKGLDHVTDVTSIINASYMEAKGDDLISRHFIADFPRTAQQREALRQQALKDPDFPLMYLSEDSRYGAIVVKTDFGATIEQNLSLDQTPSDADQGEQQSDNADSLDDEEFELDTSVDASATLTHSSSQTTATPHFKQAEIQDYSQFMAELNPIIQKPEYQKVLEFFPVGNPPVMAFFNDVLIQEMGIVSGGSILLITIVLWLLFRSLCAVVWPIAIVVVAFLLTLGLIGWSGVVMTMMINIIVFLILSVGVADAIHILSGYLFFCEQGQDHQQALRSVFRKSGLACFLTSLTTAIGLCSLAFVPIVPIRNFGLFAALGVMIAFALTVFILPLMLDIWAPVKAKETANSSEPHHPIQRFLRRIEHISFTYPKRIIAVFSILALILIWGALQVKVDSNIVKILPPDSTLRQSYDLVDSKMAGSQNIEVIFEAGQADALKDPDMLKRMDQLQNYLHQQHGDLIGKTSSLVNVTKSAFKALNGGDEVYYRIPKDPRVLAQTLFLFNNANPKDRRTLVSDDYSKARMTITIKNAGSYIYSPMIDEIQTRIDGLFADMHERYPELKVTLTGGMSLMLKLIDYISWSQIQSFGLALVVISLLLLVVFGSRRVGMLAILPNVFPIITVFGVMGFLGVSLDTDTLLIAPIIIGIAIDDTIHFLTHYRAGMLEHGDIIQSIRQTVREAGQAILFTSVVLAIGFMVFLASSHMALRNFGVLSALAITIAVMADLMLLPALLVQFKARFKEQSNA